MISNDITAEPDDPFINADKRYTSTEWTHFIMETLGIYKPIYVRSKFSNELLQYALRRTPQDDFLVCFGTVACRLNMGAVYLHFTLWPVLDVKPTFLSRTQQLELHEGMRKMLMECREKLQDVDPANPRPTTFIFVEHREDEDFHESW